jgi:hypothetical protein
VIGALKADTHVSQNEAMRAKEAAIAAIGSFGRLLGCLRFRGRPGASSLCVSKGVCLRVLLCPASGISIAYLLLSSHYDTMIGQSARLG